MTNPHLVKVGDLGQLTTPVGRLHRGSIVRVTEVDLSGESYPIIVEAFNKTLRNIPLNEWELTLLDPLPLHPDPEGDDY